MQRAHPPTGVAGSRPRAAHELVALEYGCRDVRAFVRSRESGVCYHRLPPIGEVARTAGRWLTDDLGRIRGASGRRDGRRDGRVRSPTGAIVPDYEPLLISESADPIFSEYGFEYGSLEEAFNHATSVFGDHHRRRVLA